MSTFVESTPLERNYYATSVAAWVMKNYYLFIGLIAQKTWLLTNWCLKILPVVTFQVQGRTESDSTVTNRDFNPLNTKGRPKNAVFNPKIIFLAAMALNGP